MEKTDFETIEEKDDGIETNSYFQYSEDEQETNRIAKANAKLIFCPKFIPFYPELLQHGLTHLEVLLYGFIEFYLHGSKNERFYFTNEQLCDLIKTNPHSVSDGITKLTKMGIIKPQYRIKAGGGRIRFINAEECNFSFPRGTTFPTIRSQVHGNNNKKNNNKKNIYISSSSLEQQGTPTTTKAQENVSNQGTTTLPSKEFASPPSKPPAPLSKHGIKIFQIPTAQEVEEYASSLGFKIDPERFIDYYEMVGWMVGKHPMKKWQAAVRTWKHNEKSYQKVKPPNPDLYAPRETLKESDHNDNLKTIQERINAEREFRRTNQQ